MRLERKFFGCPDITAITDITINSGKTDMDDGERGKEGKRRTCSTSFGKDSIV